MLDCILVPKDWEEVNIWTEKDPNKIGEALRHWSFVGRNGERGCYSTFQLSDFFVKLEGATLLKKEYKKYFDRADSVCYPCDDINLNCFIADFPAFKDKYFNIPFLKIILAWKWDGDGCLYFRVIGNGKDIEVINDDCKKDYEWEFVK